MPANDLSPLIGDKSEALNVEYKAWMDPTGKEEKAKLARHLAALHNYGGGYLIFGVDDATKVPQGACPFPDPIKTFGEDSFSAIVKGYLEPAFQCRVIWTEYAGNEYPIVVVPPHGSMPAIAKSGGPPDAKGRPIGIAEGALYIRVTGPSSEQIKKFSDWSDLIERCLMHRSDKLANIMRQAIGSTPRQIGPEITEVLKEVSHKTIDDYLSQVAKIIETSAARNLKKADKAFAAIAYALVDADGRLVPIDDPRALNEAVGVQVRSYAYRGWAQFLSLTSPGAAPQLHPDTIAGRETNYLEGLRIENQQVLFGELDYWRIYEIGAACTVSSYREDSVAASRGSAAHLLSVLFVLIKLHSALAHARFVAQRLNGVASIVVRLDWRDIADRNLVLDPDGRINASAPTAEAFRTTITVPWAELRDNYAAALARLAQPVFAVFNPITGYQQRIVDPAFMAEQFATVARTFRLITDDGP